MIADIILISDFSDVRFRTAFRSYFSELGIHVSDWDGLFREMNEDKNFAFLMVDGSDNAVGFLQFQMNVFSNWFFREHFGFIREFWIHPSCRGQGFGTELLHKVERYFAGNGIYKAVLTADSAEAFYLANGFEKAPGVKAKNKMEVLMKNISG